MDVTYSRRVERVKIGTQKINDLKKEKKKRGNTPPNWRREFVTEMKNANVL